VTGPLLAIDTATRRASVAIGNGRGAPSAARTWLAGYRHGEELLTVLDGLLGQAGVALADLSAVAVGTGPGAFTGLRVGLATAKGLAYGLDIPILGISTTAALAVAGVGTGDGEREVAVLLPAGPHDRYLARYRLGEAGGPAGPGASSPESAAPDPLARAPRQVVCPAPLEGPELVPGSDPLAERVAGAWLVAVDLVAGPDVPAAAVERGLRAQEGLGAALLALGRLALEAGEAADVAALVPAYVTLPRGIAEQTGGIEWSRDLR
jgi:tRNA threonylcarbamoyladenosine biosynthesis protein TsaB